MARPYRLVSAIVCSSVLSACGGGGGSSPAGPPTVTAANPPAVAAPGAATTGAPSSTSSPALPAPAAPVLSPSPSAPTLSTAGSPCTAAYSAVPGVYVSFSSFGSVVGNTYSQDDSIANLAVSNGYIVTEYNVPPPNTIVPSPSPFPTGVPVPSAPPVPLPSASPIGVPSPLPTPVPTYYQITLYVGTYTFPAFSGVNNFFSAPAGSFATQPTTGCFILDTWQRVGGLAGLRIAGLAPGVDNSEIGNAGPIFNVAETPTTLAAGNAELAFANVTSSSGNGTITLDNGVTGMATISGSATGILEGSPPTGITLEAYHRAFSRFFRMTASPATRLKAIKRTAGAMRPHR